eukprot:6206893-Pleurochrysis_carterae.AAC.3
MPTTSDEPWQQERSAPTFALLEAACFMAVVQTWHSQCACMCRSSCNSCQRWMLRGTGWADSAAATGTWRLELRLEACLLVANFSIHAHVILDAALHAPSACTQLATLVLLAPKQQLRSQSVSFWTSECLHCTGMVVSASSSVDDCGLLASQLQVPGCRCCVATATGEREGRERCDAPRYAASAARNFDLLGSAYY